MSSINGGISRRDFLRRSATAAGCLAAGLALHETALGEPKKQPPNILYILTDDQRWDAMSCMGHPFLRTPNMDRVAREGALFENAFVTISLCSPSRACFLTGAYAHRHGVVTNESNDPDPAVPTFPQLLQQAGYETAFIGKWHMEQKADPRPGFDYWLSFVGQGQYENPMLNENGRSFQAEGYMTDLLTDYAVKWLKRDRDKPFCLVLSHKAVHGPFTPAPRHKAAFPDASVPEPVSFQDSYEDKPEWHRRVLAYGARRSEWLASEGSPVPPKLEPRRWDSKSPGRLNYYRALLAVDEGIGRVFSALEAAGVMDSTFTVFAGDNGYFHGEHGRGDKRLIYEESMRIPFMIRFPGLAKPGSRIQQMSLNIDLAPTVLELAGVPVPDTVQGRSLLPLLSGRPQGWRKSFLYEYFREEWLPGLPLTLGVRTDRWKYATYPDIDDIDELYDLENDPVELHNLAQDSSYADILKQMRDELKRLKAQTGYPEGKQLGAPVAALVMRPDRPNECVLSFDFSRPQEERAVDLSGKGSHGVFHGTQPVGEDGGRRLRFADGGFIDVPASEALDPSSSPWTVEARIRSDKPDGIIVAHGGQSRGYTLYLKDGTPRFVVRADEKASEVAGKEPVTGKWVSVAGVIGRDCTLRLYVDGALAGSLPGAGVIWANPNEGLQIGMDTGTCVGSYEKPRPFSGLMDFVRIWAGEHIRPGRD